MLLQNGNDRRMRLIAVPQAEISDAAITLLDRGKERADSFDLSIAVPAPFDAPIGALVSNRQRLLQRQLLGSVMCLTEMLRDLSRKLGIEDQSAVDRFRKEQ